MSGTALSVDELNTTLNEGGGGEIDRGSFVRSDSIAEEEETTKNESQEVEIGAGRDNSSEFPEVRKAEPHNLDRAGSIDELSKEAVDRMLEGFNGLDDLESST